MPIEVYRAGKTDGFQETITSMNAERPLLRNVRTDPPTQRPRKAFAMPVLKCACENGLRNLSTSPGGLSYLVPGIPGLPKKSSKIEHIDGRLRLRLQDIGRSVNAALVSSNRLMSGAYPNSRFDICIDDAMDRQICRSQLDRDQLKDVRPGG